MCKREQKKNWWRNQAIANLESGADVSRQRFDFFFCSLLNRINEKFNE